MEKAVVFTNEEFQVPVGIKGGRQLFEWPYLCLEVLENNKQCLFFCFCISAGS